MNDRRRVNGPSGGTAPPLFARDANLRNLSVLQTPRRIRQPNTLRKMFLKTGVTPSASGSAYLELDSETAPQPIEPILSSRSKSSLKLACTVHGPRPLPRSAPFSSHIILSTHIKYAPFASGQRRGHVRDIGERDLSLHLETALRGVIIGDRWPKSGVEVTITILEGDEGIWTNKSSSEPWGTMNVLSGCITVASAAIADAGIDCVDMVAGGVAALVRNSPSSDTIASKSTIQIVLDPVPSEHYEILAACVVGYLPSRDEITDVWVRGKLTSDQSETSTYEELADNAIQAALGSHRVLSASLTAAVKARVGT